jgi:hypothetical protein
MADIVQHAPEDQKVRLETHNHRADGREERVGKHLQLAAAFPVLLLLLAILYDDAYHHRRVKDGNSHVAARAFRRKSENLLISGNEAPPSQHIC